MATNGDFVGLSLRLDGLSLLERLIELKFHFVDSAFLVLGGLRYGVILLGDGETVIRLNWTNCGGCAVFFNTHTIIL